MTNDRPNIALITSTIAPGTGAIALARRGAAERLQDYMRAFQFYCDLLREGLFDRLVYADNSGHPLDTLRAIADRNGLRSRVEFLSYTSQVPPDNYRFYLELNLISQAFLLSQFLSDPRALVWKITGRYIIRNSRSIVKRCTNSHMDVYVNCRNHPMRWTDFYIAGFNKRAFDTLFSERLDIYRAAEHGEVMLRKQLDRDASGLAIMRRFPVVPRIDGVRGFDGASYGGLRNLAKFYARSLVNLALPHLWI